MNRQNAKAFETIGAAFQKYRSTAEDIYKFYRSDMEKAELLKDEKHAKEEALKTARELFTRAEDDFHKAVDSQLDDLRKELVQHVCAYPGMTFTEIMGYYKTFGIAPGRIEIEHLVKLGSGMPLACRAINAVLTETNSPFIVKYDATEIFEADLHALERLAAAPVRYIPDGYAAEAGKIWDGTPRAVEADDGSYITTGFTWNTTSLVISSSSFVTSEKRLAETAARWTGDILPSVQQLSTNYNDKETDEDGNEITGAEAFIKDYRETGTAPTVESTADPAIDHAKNLTKSSGDYNDILGRYLK